MTMSWTLMTMAFSFAFLSVLSNANVLSERIADSCLKNTSTPIYKVDNFKYCQCCDDGYYKVGDCIVSGEKAICMPCDPGYYSSTANQAIRCSICSHPPLCRRPNTEITQNCYRTSNYECKCKDGYHLIPRQGSNGDGDCNKHSICNPGMYVHIKGTPESDTVCRPCEDSTFSDSEDYSISCSKLQQGCDPSSNATCPEIKRELPIEQEINSKLLAILLPIAIIVAVITVAVILYCLRRWGKFDVCKYIYRGKETRCNAGNVNMHIRGTCNQNDLVEVISDGITAGSEQLETDGITNREASAKNERIGMDHPRSVYAQVSNNLNHCDSGAVFKQKKNHTKQWMDCIRWLSIKLCMTSWKHIIRELFDKTVTDRTGDSVINEVQENHPRDVVEQKYQAFVKWYQLMDYRHADLCHIFNALDENRDNDIIKTLKSRYPDLIKQKSAILSAASSSDPDDVSVNSDTSSKSGID